MNTPEPTQAILARIIKLLDLADPKSGATEAEAMAAWQAAQKLITKYQIEQATLEEVKGNLHAGPARFDIGEDFVKTGRVMRVDFERNIARILSQCFNVRVLWCTESSSGRKRHAYIIIGDLMDRKIALAVYPILYSAMFAGVRRLLKKMSQERGRTVKWTADIGRSYYDGVEHGYVHESDQGKAYAIATAKKKDADAFALVLVDKKDAIVQYMAKVHTDIRDVPDKRKAELNERAWLHGAEDGRTMDLNNANKLEGAK